MKKIIALLLALSLFFLCACSNKSNSDPIENSTLTETTTQAQTTKSVKYITEWKSELLPEDFPPPPSMAYDEIVSVLAADKDYSERCYDITRLIFSCPENEFYNFSNKMISFGFYGGMKKITNGEFYSDGFWGGWRGNEYSIIIADSDYEDNGDLKICLDIVEKFSAFPDALKEYFPAFDFPARAMGIYAGNNSEIDQTNAFFGKIEHINWQWRIRFRNAFIGVFPDDFDDYCAALAEMGYEGVQIPSTVDGCSVISCDMYNKENYAALMLYNKTFKTLEVIYTNDPEAITGSQN